MHTAIDGGFYKELKRVRGLGLQERFAAADAGDVLGALGRTFLSEGDLLALLSPAAEPFLEEIAQRAQVETLRNFGRGVQFFTPLYLANYCTNRCVYCGFSAKREIRRRMLTLREVEVEAKAIAVTGLRKVLALTGDDPGRTGAAYLASCLGVLARYFSSVGIEVPSMTVEEYAMQVAAGADSMTMFQETYNRERYLELHPGGPKRDFLFRLDAPERALMGGMRAVNLGALMGLGDWREDIFAVAMHARFLSRKYPDAEVSVSLPRMRPHTDGGEVKFHPDEATDSNLVQALIAIRCFLPQCGITMSTREPGWLRDKLMPLGVTRVSAGVCTAVGGHTGGSGRGRGASAGNEDKPQFDISDGRSVDEMAAGLMAMGFQPVFSDWLLGKEGEDNLTGGVARSLSRQPGMPGEA